MKIYCDKCKKDIGVKIHEQFEKNQVGRIECPHCHTVQKRYLSEADLLIYLAYSEICYFILSFITILLFDSMKIGILTIVIVIILFAVVILTTSYFKKYIYTNGFIKKETMYIEQNENSNAIARSIRWQFLLFFALVITFFTMDEAFWFFVAASIFAILITCVKVVLAVKKEKALDK